VRKYLFIILAFAFLLRFVSLDSYPSGFSADEANQGYSAYSILRTGRDEWGELLPITPRSYGDYRAPLYTYLTIPSIAIFGLNEFAVRLPNAVVGTAAVATIFFLVKELFKNSKLALLSAILLAVSPWHIMLSRGAFETNLPTFLYPAGVLFFLMGLTKRNYMFISAMFFSLSLFAYYSSRMLFPLLAIIIYFCFVFGRRKLFDFVKRQSVAFTIVLFFSLVALYTMFAGSATRMTDVSILNANTWRSVSESRYDAVILGLNDNISRLFDNKINKVSELFVKNYLSYFSTTFLFIEGAGESAYGLVPGIGLQYLFDVVFLIFAFFFIVRQKLYKDKALLFVLLMILIAPIPAALSTGIGRAANRASLMMPWIQILIGFGLFNLLKTIKERYFYFAIAGYYILALAFFLNRYFYHNPIENSRSMSYGWKEASRYLELVEPTFDQIIVSNEFSEPQMFVAFYRAMNPTIVQAASVNWLAYEQEGLKFVDQLGTYGLGKYLFTGINYKANSKRPNTLLVGRPVDFPKTAVPMYVVNYPDGEPSMYFVASEEAYANIQ